jgi:hypothetical protein
MYNFNMSNNNNTNNNNRESKSKNDNNDNGKQQRLQQPASLRTQVDWAGEAVSLTCNLKAVCLLLLLLFCCCCFLFLVNRACVCCFVYFIFCWCDCLFFFNPCKEDVEEDAEDERDHIAHEVWVTQTTKTKTTR